MGFNQTAVRAAVEDIESAGEVSPPPPDRQGLRPKRTAGESFERFSRRPRAVLCGSYRRSIPSLLRAYEELSAAGVRVLSPSGFDFVAEIDGIVLNKEAEGFRPEAMEGLCLNCISAAHLVWLHAPDGYVGLSGALEIGFANAAGVPVYAREVPCDIALRSLVTISTMDQAIAETITGEGNSPGALRLPLQEHDASVAGERGDEQQSAQDVMLRITEEIGELARQNPGQRQRLSHSSAGAASSE